VRIRILSPPEEAGQHEVYALDLTQGGALVSQPHSRGAREHLTVIAGEIAVTSGEDSQTLQRGDTARYAADVPHAIRALGAGAKALLIVIGG